MTSQPTATPQPTISVIICAYTLERWELVTSAVRSCLQQSRLPDEVILVVDHSDQLLAESQRAFPELLIVPNRYDRGLSGSRNSGVSVASGDLLVFLDDDATPCPDWLHYLVRPFDDPDVAGVGGWVLPRWASGVPPSWFPRSFYWVVGCSYYGLPGDGAVIRNPIGANMALRRAIFDTVGGFSNALGRITRNPSGCEETELCIRYRIASPNSHFLLAKQAEVYHYVPSSRTTILYFLRRCWGEGISKATLASLAGSDASLTSERAYLRRAIPSEIIHALRGLSRAPVDSIARTFLVLLGVATTSLAFLTGRMRRHFRPY